MIDESVKNSSNGVSIAAEVRQVLDEIADGVNKTGDLVEEISSASQEQSQGIEQINQAMGQMDQVTQSNAANAEESASASEQVMSVMGSCSNLYRGVLGAKKLGGRFRAARSSSRGKPPAWPVPTKSYIA